MCGGGGGGIVQAVADVVGAVAAPFTGGASLALPFLVTGAENVISGDWSHVGTQLAGDALSAVPFVGSELGVFDALGSALGGIGAGGGLGGATAGAGEAAVGAATDAATTVTGAAPTIAGTTLSAAPAAGATAASSVAGAGDAALNAATEAAGGVTGAGAAVPSTSSIFAQAAGTAAPGAAGNGFSFKDILGNANNAVSLASIASKVLGPQAGPQGGSTLSQPSPGIAQPQYAQSGYNGGYSGGGPLGSSYNPETGAFDTPRQTDRQFSM